MNRTLWAMPLLVLVGCAADAGVEQDPTDESVGSARQAWVSACIGSSADSVITDSSAGWRIAVGDATNHQGSCGYAWIVENHNLLDHTFNLGTGIGGSDWPNNQTDCNSTYIDTWWWKMKYDQTIWDEVGVCQRRGSWVNNQCTFVKVGGNCAFLFDASSGVKSIKAATTAYRGATLLENVAGVYIH